MKPALLYSLILLRWTAFLGLTSMLALIDDIFSLLTIHVFCFYVYAARFYSIFAVLTCTKFLMFQVVPVTNCRINFFVAIISRKKIQSITQKSWFKWIRSTTVVSGNFGVYCTFLSSSYSSRLLQRFYRLTNDGVFVTIVSIVLFTVFQRNNVKNRFSYRE